MSADHADEAVCFRVAVSDDPEGPPNRLVLYDWFTRGVGRAPPRGGNTIEVLVDGEAGWGRVAEDLATATTEVQIATWMCRPDIELTRPLDTALAPPANRADARLGAQLEALAKAGTRVRLLVWGMVYTPLVDRWMRAWYWRGRDRIDVLEQDHPRLIGSHHQETITIDGRVGYCGGMNLKENDWDTIGHAPFEVRRYPHAAGPRERARAAAKEAAPPFPPRHDLMVRVEGPAVADLLHNFHERWRTSLAARRGSLLGRLIDWVRDRLGGAPNPRLEALPAAPPQPCGTHWVQIVRTTPGGEDGILGAYYRAIFNARRSIYIENQYFRSPLVGRALATALERNPRLRLFVVVKPINGGKKSYLDPSGYWTAHTLKMIRDVRPDFQLTEVVTWGRDAAGRVVYQSVDVHAKVMVVDDVWVTVGSANINDRGFKYEGEINAVVLDRAVAGDLRKRLMAEHLEWAVDDERLDDIDVCHEAWCAQGRENPGRRARGEAPEGRVHFFEQEAPAKPPFGIDEGVF